MQNRDAFGINVLLLFAQEVFRDQVQGISIFSLRSLLKPWVILPKMGKNVKKQATFKSWAAKEGLDWPLITFQTLRTSWNNIRDQTKML